MHTNRRYQRLRVFGAAIAIAGCVIVPLPAGPVSVVGADVVGPASALAADVSMNFGDVRQTIDGFGASDAWADSAGPAFTDAESDLFFSAQNGIGLSYLRLSIEANGSDSAAISNAQKAAARGARVWAAPWSAPASWKDNGDVSNGGHLCAAAGQGLCTASRYDDWATRLAGFVSMMKSNGVDLYGLSVQNEPDWTAPYGSMLYTDREMVDFVKTLGPRLASMSPRPKLMVGEFANWGNIWSLANAIEADPVASSYTNLYGAHQYFGTSSFQSGHSKPLWQTEMSGFDSFDPGIDNAINVAGWINDALTNGNANAWHYWWLRGLNENNEGLVGHLSDMYAMTKRLFVMGNYSKFVRPGWVRIGTSGYAAGIDTIAFKNAATGEFAVVVTNHGSAATLTMGVSGATVQSQVTPYQTYDDGSGNFTIGTHGNLERRAPIDSIAGGGFTATVPHGVTTFVGVAGATTQVTAPGAFSKVAPASGTAGQSTSLTLSWGAASGATSYEYCIDTTSDNACSAWTSTGTATSAFVSGLSSGTAYYWHVRASNSGGTTYANGSSTTFWGFSTQAAVTAPGTFGKSAPPNGSVGQATSLTVSWGAASGATSYQYCIDTTSDNACSAWTSTGTATSAFVSGLSSGAVYYWHVRASNSGGTTYANGGSAAFWSFTTQGGGAPLVTTNPATGITRTTATLNGTVNPNGVSTEAWFEYGTTTAYGAYVWATPSLGLETSAVAVSATLTNLTCGATYHFRLVGYSAVGTARGSDSSFVACGGGTASQRGVRGDVDGDGKADLATYRPSTGEWSMLKSDGGFTSSSVVAWGLPADTPVPGDYDGDGKTDIATYQPATGAWRISWSTTNFATSNRYNWGHVGDLPQPADYDGDGKTDLAVYRPTTGGWWILTSSTNFVEQSNYAWGLPGDVPVPGDYDGDGKADLAIYRPTTGGWWILKSSTNYVHYSTYDWGMSGDVPVTGDYDGDGNTDIAVYRPSTGGWWISWSSTNFTTHSRYEWGQPGDMPKPADCDGDGKTDIAVYRPTTGGWWILTSSTYFTAHSNYAWGLPGDDLVPADFDGDGKADPAIYRPTTGGWWILRSSTNHVNYSVYDWGMPGDVPVPGDYDGDGKVDLATYQPATGAWRIAWSKTDFATNNGYNWGLAGDVPQPADYDGDGKTDLALYRPATGSWWIVTSSTNFAAQSTYAWGLPGDQPVPADYDGDGKTDLAIYRPTTGGWWILESSTNYIRYSEHDWGMPGDVPVPGDYDGDGKADIAVYRATTGGWWIARSSTNFVTVNEYGWGIDGDVPVPADYDGDGKTDIAVFRPSTGGWWILKSISGFTVSINYNWGASSDVPLTKAP
ncbi:MAG: FG-GAP-like repeat-containing protein [Vicinamibacterales bacterium]